MKTKKHCKITLNEKIKITMCHIGTSPVAVVVKNPLANTGRGKSRGFSPWVGKIPGGGHGDPLQYSCPENPTNRGAWGLQYMEPQSVRHD